MQSHKRQISVKRQRPWLGTLSLRRPYLDLHKVHRLHESGLSRKLASVQHSAGCGNDLATTTMDSISMQGDVMDVVTAGTHVLFTEDTLEKAELRYISLHDTSDVER